jgi:hypothetical protein
MSAPMPGRSAIEARGQIQLGRKCLLLEKPRAALFPAFTYSAFRPADGTVAAVDMPPVARPGELPTQQLDWMLKTTDADLCISDAGLMGSEIESEVMAMLSWVFSRSPTTRPPSDRDALTQEWMREDGAGGWFWLNMLSYYQRIAVSEDGATGDSFRHELLHQVLGRVGNNPHPFWRWLITAKDTAGIDDLPSAPHGDRLGGEVARQAHSSTWGSRERRTPPTSAGAGAYAWAPRPVANLMRQIREEHERKSAELERNDAILAAQTRAQNDLAYTKLVSKIAELDHQKQMAIIDNIK